MAGSINSKTLNIGGADPIQGFDVGVWVQDVGTNQQVLAGQFTSLVVTIRNATEAYIEMGQRYPRYLDGEMQIAFVAEKGLLDINVFQETFGYKRLSRSKRFGRSPRFNLTFGVNPVDADVLEEAIKTNIDEVSGGLIKRDVTGRFVLEQCKIDSWHFASTAGRQVVATQWQGVAEGISAIPSDYSISTDGASPRMVQTDVKLGFASNTFYKEIPDGVANTNITTQGYGGL